MSLRKYTDIKDVPPGLRERVLELAHRSKFDLKFCSILYQPHIDNVSLVNYSAPPSLCGDCGASEK